MRDPKRCLGAGAIGLAAALLLLAGPTVAAPADPFVTMKVEPAVRETQAPSFRLRTLEGKPLALEDLRGKVVLFYFWRTW